MKKVIEGKRIRLRHLVKSDAPGLYKYVHVRDVLYYTGIPHNPYKLEHAERFIKQTKTQHRKGINHHHCLEHKETGEIIGMVSLFRSNIEEKSRETGCWLAKPYWGQGLMNEATTLVMAPTNAAHQGPKTTAVTIVPIMSRKMGRFKTPLIYDPTIFKAAATGTTAIT